MNGLIINYVLFKKLINKLPNVIQKELNYTDESLINLSSFYDTAIFFSYPKIDKYDLYNKILESKNNLIIELVIKLSKDNDFNKLLLLYAIICKITFNEEIYKYLKNYNYNQETILDELDSYYIQNNNIDYKSLFKNSFIYNEYYEELIHYPFVKLYNFYSTNNYYQKAYKKEKKYYKHFKLNKNLDNKILNLDNNTIFIDIDNKTIKLKTSLDEYLDYIVDIILDKITKINEYLFENKEKSFKKLYNIEDDYKI